MITQLEAHYRQIEQAMVNLQRTSWRGILPLEVMEWLDADVSLRQVEADMYDLYKVGRLIKVSRGSAVKQYRLATGSQRAAFTERFGMRPRGDVSVSEHTQLVYEAIEKAVAKAYRNLGRGVLPRDIQVWLPWDRAEGSLRRDMLDMYQAGRLVRVAGHGARQGYRLPHLVEKLAFSINQGMWPYGAELVAVGLG